MENFEFRTIKNFKFKSVSFENEDKKLTGTGILVAKFQSPSGEEWYGTVWDSVSKKEIWVNMNWVKNRKEDKTKTEKSYIRWIKYKVKELKKWFIVINPYKAEFVDEYTGIRLYLLDRFQIPAKYLDKIIPDKRIADVEISKICNIVFSEKTEANKKDTIRKLCKELEIDKLDAFEESLKMNLVFFEV